MTDRASLQRSLMETATQIYCACMGEIVSAAGPSDQAAGASSSATKRFDHDDAVDAAARLI